MEAEKVLCPRFNDHRSTCSPIPAKRFPITGEHYHHEDGNKTTLHTMRNLLFERRNFTLQQDSKGNFILTLLDTNGNDLEQRVATMLDERMTQGLNKVLWWENRGLILRFDDQYKPEKMSGKVAKKVSGKEG